MGTSKTGARVQFKLCPCCFRARALDSPHVGRAGLGWQGGSDEMFRILLSIQEAGLLSGGSAERGKGLFCLGGRGRESLR